MKITAASCFSGIGGAESALPEAKWRWCAELDDAASEVLATRFPHSLNLGDVLQPDFIDRAAGMGSVDILCGGPPCQAFSVAGLRGGMSDPRGQLSIRFVDIAHAIGPRNLLVENVPGWLNHSDNAFGCFVGAIVGADDALFPCERPASGKPNAGWKWRKAKQVWCLKERDEAGEPVIVDSPADYAEGECEQINLDARHIPVWPRAGMVAGPRARAAWRVFDAQYFGLAQRRERVFVVVDFGDGADPAAVLFEPNRGIGDPAASRKAGQRIAGTLSARTEGGGGLGTDFELGGGLTPACVASHAGEIAGPITAGIHKGPRGTEAVDSDWLVAHTLRGEGFDASEDGTGRGTPLVPIAFPAELSGTQVAAAEDRSPSLSVKHTMAVAFSSQDHGADASADLSPTLRSMGHTDSHANGGGQVAIATQWAVRRLTPAECETLQGYPAGYTLIETGKRRTVEPDEAEYLRRHGAIVTTGNDGKLRTNAAADGPRYKQLGNAWAVPCARWILLRIVALLPENSTHEPV